VIRDPPHLRKLSTISTTIQGNVLADSIPPIILLEAPFGCVMLEVCRSFVLNVGNELDVILESGFDDREFSLESMFGYIALAIPHASTTEK
jgi:hypothetical protein